MQATAAVFKWMGLVMLVAGVALGAWAAVADSELALGLGIVGATLAVVGVVFVPIGLWLGGLDTSEILRTGIPGTAQVLSTRGRSRRSVRHRSTVPPRRPGRLRWSP